MEVLERDLKVMDSTATAMCRDNKMPLLVFAIEDPENIVRAVKGEKNRNNSKIIQVIKVIKQKYKN